MIPASLRFERGPSRRGALPLALAVAFLLALAAAAGAQSLPAEFMPVGQIRPGMIGEGRTVFQGYKIETFKAEILGVEHNYFAGGDIIYARLSGGPLEQHGVVAGMSGSPVYIDGKLIGAVAYGWSFSYKPYCGITPIEQMYTVYQNIGKLKQPDDPRSVSSAPGQPWDWEPVWNRYRGILDGSDAAPAAPADSGLSFHPRLPALANETGAMRPLAAPLYLSGASPRTEKMLRRFFASRGLELFGAGTLAGSAGTDRETAPPLEAGSALGIPLLSGDLSLSGIGTATWVQGGRVIAFGHPMFSMGSVHVPMSPAYMLGVMQSYQSSFKLGEVGPTIGTIDQDRLFGIGGTIGAAPPRVPISVRIGGAAVAIPRSYSFSAWKNADQLPALLISALQESFSASVSETGKNSADIRYTLSLTDGRRIEKSVRSSSDDDVSIDALTSVLRDLVLLLQNPFAEASLASVDVSADVRPGYRESALLSIDSDRDEYKPGETVKVGMTVRTWHGDDSRREVAFQLPDDLKPGMYVLQVTDAAGSQRLDRAMHPGAYQPRSFDDVVAYLQRNNPRSQNLTVTLLEPAIDLDLRGDVFRRVPASISSIIEDTAPPRDLQPAVGRAIVSRTFDNSDPISGSQAGLINVVSHMDE